LVSYSNTTLSHDPGGLDLNSVASSSRWSHNWSACKHEVPTQRSKAKFSFLCGCYVSYQARNVSGFSDITKVWVKKVMTKSWSVEEERL